MNRSRFTFMFVSLCLVALQCAMPAQAQSWQWGKVGKDIPNTSNDITRNSIATDPNGNLYTINIDSNINVPGHFRAGYSSSNLCIVSYDCQGNFRWSKMIEGGNELSNQIKTDKLGGVYVNATIIASMKSLKLDEDAMIPQTEKNFIVVKFDTSGNYKWHYMPEPDSLSPKKYDYNLLTMDVSANGSIRELVLLGPNAFCDSNYIVTDTPFSLHIISHTSDGKFDKAVKLDITGNSSAMFRQRMAWDAVNDKFYLYQIEYRYDTLMHGTILVTDKGLVLSKFDNLGKNEWVKTEALSSYSSFMKVITDEDGSVYMSCMPMVGSIFDGYTFNNESGKGITSAILKYDKNGNRLWVANTKVGGAEDIFTFAKSNNSLAVYAPIYRNGFVPFVRWETGFDVGTSFFSYPSVFHDSLNRGSYFVRFDATTGAVMNVDSILGANLLSGNIYGNAKGGFYILGMMQGINQVLAIPNKDTMRGVFYATGGIGSPFLLKYGTNDCGLTSISSSASAISELRIYPNPSSDFIFIENARKSSKVNIYNTLGQVVVAANLSENKVQLNVQHLVAGMYIVEVVSQDNQRERLKLLKQ